MLKRDEELDDFGRKPIGKHWKADPFANRRHEKKAVFGLRLQQNPSLVQLQRQEETPEALEATGGAEEELVDASEWSLLEAAGSTSQFQRNPLLQQVHCDLTDRQRAPKAKRQGAPELGQELKK